MKRSYTWQQLTGADREEWMWEDAIGARQYMRME